MPLAVRSCWTTTQGTIDPIFFSISDITKLSIFSHVFSFTHRTKTIAAYRSLWMTSPSQCSEWR